MISINFTLVIEIILFLLFFIFARKFIWGPLLETINSRDQYFSQKETEIEKLSHEAKTLREEYKSKIEHTQKALETKADNIIRNAYMQQRVLIEQKQKEAHEQLILFQHELQKQFCMNNAEIDNYSKELTEKIIQCLLQQRRIF